MLKNIAVTAAIVIGVLAVVKMANITSVKTLIGTN
jgi:hypothetical protein